MVPSPFHAITTRLLEESSYALHHHLNVQIPQFKKSLAFDKLFYVKVPACGTLFPPELQSLAYHTL